MNFPIASVVSSTAFQVPKCARRLNDRIKLAGELVPQFVILLQAVEQLIHCDALLLRPDTSREGNS